MKTARVQRTFNFQGIHFRIWCSEAVATYLEGRLRMLPTGGECVETVCLDFHAAEDPSQHVVNRPHGEGRPFYEMPRGEACYFGETDEIYISYGDGVRAHCNPRSDSVLISTVESAPKNMFMASHLVLTILLIEILKRRDWYSLHAAAFSENGKAILIPGTSGAGKSTLSIALLRAEFDYLSDDMVFLRRRADDVVARGLAEDVDVTEQTIRFFPELDFLLRSPKSDGFPKRQVRPEEVYGTKVITEEIPKAIILPRVSGKQKSVLTQIEGDEALHEIVPNVLLTEAHACEKHLSALAHLVKQVACYRLDTGQDFDDIPALFRGLLRRDTEKVCA